MKNDLNESFEEVEPRSGATASLSLPLWEQKRRLRQALLASKHRASVEADPFCGRAVCEKIAALPCFLEASALLFYYPTRGEIDLLPLARLAWERGIPVGFPVCYAENNALTFRRATEKTQFAAGLYGIPVPPTSEPELVCDSRTVCFVPALGYDKTLHRIGHGGGYYDRFLAGFPGKAVGVTFENELLQSAFCEPHDRPVDILVTEKRVYTQTKD